MRKKLLKLAALSGCLLCVMEGCKSESSIPQDWLLDEGWKVQSSAKVSMDGKTISQGKIDLNGWYDATVPSTVMGVLTANGLYADALEGLNYKKIDKTLFDTTWWYRKEFEVPRLKKGESLFISFEGISYAANVWLNGHQIATRDSLLGPFRQFKYEISSYLQSKNVLAVEVFKAGPGDPNIGFVDWNPRPADENMGIFREVRLHRTGAVSIEHSVVRSKVNTETLKEAFLTVQTELTNLSDQPVEGVLKGVFEDGTFSYPVTIPANTTQQITLTSKEIETLHLQNPRLWWCRNLGAPEMYHMDLTFEVGQVISDQAKIAFGVRELGQYYTPEGYRGFMLNGKKVLVRSAGWTDDIFLRDTPKSNETQVQYVADMNLNSIRFENIWGTSQNVYDLCDQYGLLALVGWSCHWEWENYLGSPCDEYGGIKTEENMNLIARSLNDQVLWLRNHPSIIAWFVGSDMLPRPELEKRYLSVLEKIDDRPYVAAAKAWTSSVSGPTGMKMAGPYEYVGPEYWYDAKAPGGAFGFNTETGIGAQLPVKESLRKMIPADKLWPLNEVWDYHCTTSASDMNSMNVLRESVTARYGEPTDLDDFLRKADLLNYEGTRAMFEAFRVNIPRTTGIVQWMLNSAWPSLYWQLYDYYLIPTASYYSVKRANAPQQLIYDYGRKRVIAVNEGLESRRMKAQVALYDLSGQLLWKQETPIAIDPYTTVEAFKVPTIKTSAFLFLTLVDEKAGSSPIENFYCLSPLSDQYDWDKSSWVRTPSRSLADFSSLTTLAPAVCSLQAKSMREADKTIVEVTVENQTPGVALMLRLSLSDEQGELIKPVFWDDNYFSLTPKGHKTLRVVVPDSTIKGANLSLTLSGWNVKENKIKLNLEN